MTSAANQVKDEFQKYLEGFNLEDRHKKKKKPSVCYQASTEAAHAARNETLTKSLREQKEKHQQKINQAKTEHMPRFKVELGQRYGFHPEITPFTSFIKEFIEKLKQLDNKEKSDLESSASTWNMEHLKRHRKTLKINYVQPYYHKLTEEFLAYNVPDDLFMKIQERYVELATVYLGMPVTQALELGQDVSFLRAMQNYQFREATTRVFIDTLITPTLLPLGMQVRLEEPLYKHKDKKNSTLPISKADYVIYSSDGKILGAIETKNGGYLTAESVIQCMLQLLALHRKAPHTLFGIITDGVRYVFIVLTKDGTFEFERESGVTEGGSYDVNTWGDLRLKVGVFNWLLKGLPQ